MGSVTHHLHADPHHNIHSGRKHPRHTQCVYAQAAANRAELFHRLACGRRYDRRHSRAAAECRLLNSRQVDIRHSRVQNVGDIRCHVLYGVHPESMRDRFGSFLGYYRPDQLRPEAHAKARPVDDRRSMGTFANHQLAAADRVERLAAT